MKQLETVLFALAWILIPASLLYLALAGDSFHVWQRIADRGARRVER